MVKDARCFSLEKSEFIYKYIVLMSDVDLFKHMSYANYLKLLFLASDALLLPSLTESFIKSYRLRPIRTQMKFKYQTRLGERILIKVSSEQISISSFDLLYDFVLEDNTKQIGYGKQSFVIEKLSKEKAFIPEYLLMTLRQIELTNYRGY